jgi:hypothetical protein
MGTRGQFDAGDEDYYEPEHRQRGFYFWKFVHNALIHPLMSGPWKEPKWLNRLHDWTAKRCPGAG